MAAVCSDSLRHHSLSVHHRGTYQGAGEQTGAWTASRYVALEREQIQAGDARDAWESRLERQREDHARRIIELQERQQALRLPAAQRVSELTGTQAFVHDLDQGPQWAMGLPVEAGANGVAAVICPVASRIEGRVRTVLAPLLLFAASEAEADRIRQQADPAQRVEVLVGELASQVSAPTRTGWTPRTISRRMLGR